MAALEAGVAGNGWVRTKRQSRTSAPPLRGECRVDCRCDAVEAGSRRQARCGQGTSGFARTWHRHGDWRSGETVVGSSKAKAPAMCGRFLFANSRRTLVILKGGVNLKLQLRRVYKESVQLRADLDHRRRPQ